MDLLTEIHAGAFTYTFYSEQKTSANENGHPFGN